MSVISTVVYNYSYSDVVKHEYEPAIAFCRERLIANEGSALAYTVGTVVGIVTATGKIKRQEASAVDGSQVAAGVVVENKAVPATTDTGVLVMVRGPAIVNKAMLTMGASTDTDAEKLAVYTALAAKNILANTGI